jgi:hypothetical protein
VLNPTTPTLHEAPEATAARTMLGKLTTTFYDQDVIAIHLHTFISSVGSAEAPPLIASLERIASLRPSGALSEHECARLKKVLLESAAAGMTL